MIINNAYSSNPYANIQNTNLLQNIQPADTAESGRANNSEDMTTPSEPINQSGSQVNQAFEVSITPEAQQQSLAYQTPVADETPQTGGYGQTTTQDTRQAVETGQIINLTG